MVKQRKTRFRPAYAVIILILAAAAAVLNLHPVSPVIAPDGSLTVHYIDVGQGDAQLIVTPDNKAMLIDAGPNSAQDRLIAYLDAQDINELEYAVFTHPHEDHIGGADEVMKKTEVKNVILPDAGHDSETYFRMLEAVDASGSAVTFAVPGEAFTLGGASFVILAPVSDGHASLNNYSVVLRLDYGETSFLFTGDAEEESESEMLSMFGMSEFVCDVYKAGHHGSSTSNTRRFLEACSPSYAVISCGEGNDYGHPHYEITEMFADMGVVTYRTDTDGTVVFKSDGEEVKKINR
jgi:competence protein ComEC